jgi:hypothetical protein
MNRSIALADKITTRAEDALADLEREMIIREWPDEFQAIMWEAVAAVASSRAAAAKRS